MSNKNLYLFSSLVFTTTCGIFLFTQVVSSQANYTAQERHALDKLHQLADHTLKLDYQKYDGYLIRWLRARNFDVVAANEMLQESLKWRKANRIDTIRNEVLFQFNPPVYEIDGHDYEGRPIITFSPTSVDLRRLVLSGQGENVSRYWDQILEEAEYAIQAAADKSGGRIFQGNSLMDMHGFNIRSHACLGCINVFINWVYSYERYHPEMAKNIVWINVPRIFLPIFEGIKPLLSSGTRKALKLIPSNKKEWSAYLFKIAAPDQLPVNFGGTKKRKAV